MSAVQRPRRQSYCLLPLVVAVALLTGATELFGIGFDRYHTQEEINSYMRTVAADHPDLVRYHLLGYSDEGRDIGYVVISEGDPAQRPALYLNGTHHGNEKSSTEAVLAMIDHLIRHRRQGDVARLLDQFAVYLQPLVNPDGHARNTRADIVGRDPNRDYGEDGLGGFNGAPTRFVKQLVDRIKPRAAAALHSGMEAVLWPHCSTPRPARDQDLFYTLARTTASAMGIKRYAQSFFDYPSKGEFIDYVYNAHETLALTIEVSKQGNPAPSLLPSVVRRSITGAMTFMTAVQDYDGGQLAVHRAPPQTPRHNDFFAESDALASRDH